MKLQESQIIGERYVVEENKVREGIVELWDAMDRQLERPVVIQVLSPQASRDPDVRNAFVRHQQIAASVHNSTVQGVYDLGVWEDRPFSVMQRCEGVPVSSLYRADLPPDIASAMIVTRQVADGLQSCRDAGLTDWELAPENVRVDAGGNAFFPILESARTASTDTGSENDVAALGGLLRLLLTGQSDSKRDAVRAGLVPTSTVNLLERLDSWQEEGGHTAGEVAAEIAALEAASLQPTQAYESSALVPENGVESKSQAYLVDGRQPDPSEAPTLAAPVLLPGAAYELVAVETAPTAPKGIAIGSQPSTLPLEAYAPPAVEHPAPMPVATRKSLVPARMLPLLGLLLLAVLAVWVVLLASGALNSRQPQANASASGSASATPSSIVVAAPDLLGKSLDDAAIEAKSAGLKVFQNDSSYDATYEAGKVASQQPPPGEPIQAGSYITISLSLGPEPVVNTAPNPSTDNPPPQPAPGNGKSEDKGKHKGKDK